MSTTAHHIVYQSKKPTRNNRIAFARVMVTADMSSLSFSYELTGIYLCSHFLYSLFRDPRWGRGQETAGECPFLSSEYVTAFITSFQGGGGGTFQGAVNASSHEAAPAYMMAAAVVKHAGEQLHRISLYFFQCVVNRSLESAVVLCNAWRSATFSGCLRVLFFAFVTHYFY